MQRNEEIISRYKHQLINVIKEKEQQLELKLKNDEYDPRNGLYDDKNDEEDNRISFDNEYNLIVKMNYKNN